MKRMMKSVAVLLSAAAWIAYSPTPWAQTDTDRGHADLAAALNDVGFSLEERLGADVTLVKGAQWKTAPEKLD